MKGPGSPMQKPLPIVVVDGMILVSIVILITLPVLIALFSRRHVNVEHGDLVVAPVS
jgi:multidrug efflux pump subunit AcrB